MMFSRDQGRTWTDPRVINDTPIDDRDAGLVSLGGAAVMVTWFTYAAREHIHNPPAHWTAAWNLWPEPLQRELTGSWARVSHDAGLTWGPQRPTPVSAPCGPIMLRDGRLLYLGKAGYPGRLGTNDMRPRALQAHASGDQGETWQHLGDVPAPDAMRNENMYEPHVLELPDGRLLGMIRIQRAPDEDANAPIWQHHQFSLAQTTSDDGGRPWSQARCLGVMGSPPHLMQHSSGAIICTFGYRLEPFGQRAIISHDAGQTWSDPIVLREDGPDSDLGYPATLERPDGTLFTVYYQKPRPGKNTAILYSQWTLPRR